MGPFNLWKTPTQAERGYELRELVTKDRASITCAAFAGGNSRFVITGSKEGFVHVWTMPQQAEVNGHRIFSDASNKELRLDLVEQDLRRVRHVLQSTLTTHSFPRGSSCWSPGQRATVMIRWNKEWSWQPAAGAGSSRRAAGPSNPCSDPATRPPCRPQ